MLNGDIRREISLLDLIYRYIMDQASKHREYVSRVKQITATKDIHTNTQACALYTCERRLSNRSEICAAGGPTLLAKIISPSNWSGLFLECDVQSSRES